MQAEQAPAPKAAAARVRVTQEPSEVLGKRISERLRTNPPKPFIFDDEVCMGWSPFGARAVGPLVPPPMPLGRNRPSCARNAQAAEERIINKPKPKLPKPAAQTSRVRQPASKVSKVPPPSQRPPCQSCAPFKFVLMLRPSSREPGWTPCHCRAHHTCMACVAAENFAPARHVRFPPAERKEKMP
jgi:hypothetical protein